MYALQPLALAVVSVRAFRTVAHAREHGIIIFFSCLVFSKKFNILSALFVSNRSPCGEKTILAKVCFDAKRG